MKLDNLFGPEHGFAHSALLDGSVYPWSPVSELSSYIQACFSQGFGSDSSDKTLSGAASYIFNRKNSLEKMICIEKPVLTERAVYLADLQIYIGKGTVLEPTAIIKSPAIIGTHCEVRQGAYLRGNVLVGDHSVIGHTTEVKNSIFMNHSDAGHFSYIGDSIIGNYVNLGAGTKIANLQFRTVEEKKSGQIRTIQISHDGEIVDTNVSKLGALIGDGCELGCNSVTSPGTILGKKAQVFPLTTVKKGVYPAGAFIR